MKYKRKKDDRKYNDEINISGNKKRKKSIKIILGIFLFPVFISLMTGVFTYERTKISETVSFFRTVGKDMAMYVSQRMPSVSKIGKKGAQFCFEYIRNGKNTDINPKTNSASEVTSVISVIDTVDKATEAKADSSPPENSNPPKMFSPIMPCAGEISSPFGKRVHPLSGEETTHNGIDIAANTGTDILCVEDGTVQKSEYNQFSGNFIVIAHSDGYTSSYAHLMESKVKPGDTIKKGQLIGISGSTGAVTGPHLHMEIRKDSTPVDPMTLIKVN